MFNARAIASRWGVHKSLLFITLCLAFLMTTPLFAELADDEYLMTPIDDKIVAVDLIESGKTEDDVVQAAASRSVMIAAGRLYFEDSLLIATDILENYLTHQYQKFVVSTKVLKNQYVEGSLRLEVKTYVDIEKLRSDLNEKRFIIQPRLKPYFDVYLSEKVQGQEATENTGYQTIVNILRDEPNVRVNTSNQGVTPTNVNVMRSPTILRSSLITAQKGAVELIITGTSNTVLDRTEELYYTTYYFYTSTVELTLIRVDTGETLATAKSEKLASATSQQDSANLAVRLAVTDSMNQLLDYYRDNWQIMIGHDADYIFMFTSVNEKELDTLLDTLNGIGIGAKAYVKNKWRDLAVVTLSFDGPESLVQQFIEANPYPVISLVSKGEKKFELQVD